MFKKHILISIAILVVITLLLFLSIKNNEVQIFPFRQNDSSSFNTMHEDVKQDFSKISAVVNQDSVLELNYELSKTIQEPFVGVYFHKPESEKIFFDFNDFDVLAIDLSSSKGKRIPIHLTINYEGITSLNKKLSSLPLVNVIEYTGPKIYYINKNDFEIPSWWLRYHGITKDSISNLNFSRIDYIVVNSCQTIGGGVKDTIKVKSIVFKHSNQLLYVVYVVLVFMTLIVSFILYLSKQKKVLIPYKMQADSSVNSIRKIDKIMLYIAQNYQNPELSIGDLQKDLGIATRDIGNEIKEKLNASTYRSKTFVKGE